MLGNETHPKRLFRHEPYAGALYDRDGVTSARDVAQGPGLPGLFAFRVPVEKVDFRNLALGGHFDAEQRGVLAVHGPLNALTKDFHVLDFRFGVGLPKPLFRVLGGFGQDLVVEHRDGLVERRVGHAEFEVEQCAPRPLVPVQPERYFHAGQLELWVALRAAVGIDVNVLPPHGILLWRFDEDVVEVEVRPDGCAHGVVYGVS